MQYTREDGCLAWLACSLLNPDTSAALLQDFGSAEGLYDYLVAHGGEFLRSYGVSDKAIGTLVNSSDREKMHEMLLLMRRLNAGILSILDPRYPDMLRHIQQPPTILFYRGNPDCLLGKCIAIVGSRSVSPQGVQVTRKISRELSQAGVTIVSGLAMGVDAEAHLGCLEGGAPTAAVMACGIDVDYPMENYDLKERIVREGGVLLSEYPLGMHGSKHVFQMRNRIVSGLANAVPMMEGQVRAGSMITVQHALDQGREVFAYPGVPGTEYAQGAHQLLREGANYFTSAQDVLEDLGWAEDAPLPSGTQKKELPEMTDEQRKIYALLGRGEMSFDELAAETGLPAPQLSVSLTLLQMSGVIRALPGKAYSRN